MRCPFGQLLGQRGQAWTLPPPGEPSRPAAMCLGGSVPSWTASGASAGCVLCPLLTCREPSRCRPALSPRGFGVQRATASTREGPAGLPGMVLGPRGLLKRKPGSSSGRRKAVRRRSSRGRWSPLQDVREALPVLQGVPALALSFPLAFLSFLREHWPGVLGPVVLWVWSAEGRRGGGPLRSTELALPCFTRPPRPPGRARPAPAPRLPPRTPGRRPPPACTPSGARSGAGPSALG